MLHLALLPLLFSGCASTGLPRPPSLHVVQAVRNLTAQRIGNHVDLGFTVPTLSTDRQPLAGKHGAGTLTAELCRYDGPGSLCTALRAQTALPGEAVRMRDDLPRHLSQGPPSRLRYIVHILNGQGRSSADSREAVAVAGTAPEPLQALAAATVARGIQLTWRAMPQQPGTHLQIEAETGDTRRTLTVAGDSGGAIDAAPRVGQTVTYSVFRSLAIPGTPPADAHGEPAGVTVTRTADTFPPAVPTGLVAIAVQLEHATPEIDLSWEADAEPDLVGYLVERADTGRSTPAVLLTPAPVPTASFRDTTATPGHTYRYTVRAQDATGNRSQPSAPAVESLQP